MATSLRTILKVTALTAALCCFPALAAFAQEPVTIQISVQNHQFHPREIRVPANVPITGSADLSRSENVYALTVRHMRANFSRQHRHQPSACRSPILWAQAEESDPKDFNVLTLQIYLRCGMCNPTSGGKIISRRVKRTLRDAGVKRIGSEWTHSRNGHATTNLAMTAVMISAHGLSLVAPQR